MLASLSSLLLVSFLLHPSPGWTDRADKLEECEHMLLPLTADTWTRVETNAGFGPRNAHVLCRLGDGGFVVNGGWVPFVSTYDDTLRLEVDSS